MRKLYQTEWHNIKFNEITKLSEDSLPNDRFYNSFYKEFFNRYDDFADLNSDWIKLKEGVADHCAQKYFKNKQDSILSVGCGIGIIEKKLLEKGFSQIYITENSEASLNWIKKLIPKTRIFVSSFLEKVPDRSYNNILLSSVDYFLTDNQLDHLLKSALKFLDHSGQLLLVSWSFDSDSTLECSDNKNGQFWGWIRTIDEYKYTIKNSGFRYVEHEIIETKTKWKTLILSAQL
jgi:ubiquinone/menaquinone biosynthesis C-methylase UbiE